MDNNADTLRRLLTPMEVAQELRISRGTVYRLARQGLIPTIRVGGQLRVPSKSLVSTLARSARPGS